MEQECRVKQINERFWTSSIPQVHAKAINNKFKVEEQTSYMIPEFLESNSKIHSSTPIYVFEPNMWLIKWTNTWLGLQLNESFLSDSLQKILSKKIFKACLQIIATREVGDCFNIMILWSIKKHRTSSCPKIQKLFKTVSTYLQTYEALTPNTGTDNIRKNIITEFNHMCRCCVRHHTKTPDKPSIWGGGAS